jgi:hypothetical protein
VDVEPKSNFPRLSELPDCQRCEPISPYVGANPGAILLRNLATGEELRVCVSCLEHGVGYEELTDAA